MKTYLEPLKKETFLSNTEINALFGNIQEIFGFQQQFLQTLENALETPKTNCHPEALGDLFGASCVRAQTVQEAMTCVKEVEAQDMTATYWIREGASSTELGRAYAVFSRTYELEQCARGGLTDGEVKRRVGRGLPATFAWGQVWAPTAPGCNKAAGPWSFWSGLLFRLRERAEGGSAATGYGRRRTGL